MATSNDLEVTDPRWFTLSDAAAYLTTAVGRSFDEADLLDFALKDQLTLSVRLRLPTLAWYFDPELFDRLEDSTIVHPAESRATNRRRDVLVSTEEARQLDGLFDVVMAGNGRRAIEHRLAELLGLPLATLTHTTGAVVETAGIMWMLGYDGSGYGGFRVWPKGSQFVLRRNLLEALVADQQLSVSEALAEELDFVQQTARQTADKDLNTKPRAMLLVIIGTLAKQLGIDTTKHTLAATTILELVYELNGGLRLGDTTVSSYLRQIPHAIGMVNDLDTKSQATLLVIVAALAKKLGNDAAQDAMLAAKTMRRLVHECDKDILLEESAIVRYLVQIPDAIERKLDLK